MTYNQFLQLDEAEQLEAIWAGEFIDQRLLNEYRISLYWLNGLYVEVYYNHIKNFIRKFEPLQTIDKEVALIAYTNRN